MTVITFLQNIEVSNTCKMIHCAYRYQPERQLIINDSDHIASKHKL
jgi:hypothetical protein